MRKPRPMTILYLVQLKSNVDDVISRDVKDLIKLIDFSEKWSDNDVHSLH